MALSFPDQIQQTDRKSQVLKVLQADKENWLLVTGVEEDDSYSFSEILNIPHDSECNYQFQTEFSHKL